MYYKRQCPIFRAPLCSGARCSKPKQQCGPFLQAEGSALRPHRLAWLTLDRMETVHRHLSHFAMFESSWLALGLVYALSQP